METFEFEVRMESRSDRKCRKCPTEVRTGLQSVQGHLGPRCDRGHYDPRSPGSQLRAKSSESPVRMGYSRLTTGQGHLNPRSGWYLTECVVRSDERSSGSTKRV